MITVLIQPQPIFYVNSNTPAAFQCLAVASTGSELSYQWQYYNGDSWNNGSATGNATRCMRIANIATQVAANTKYRCAISDGSETVYTQTVGYIELTAARAFEEG